MIESEKPIRLEEEIERWWGQEYMKNSIGLPILPIVQGIARHFAEWQKEQDDKLVDIIYQQGIEKGKDDMKEQIVKEFETWLKGNLHHLSCWNVDEFCTDLKCYLGMKDE